MPTNSSLLSEDNILSCLAKHCNVTHPSVILGRGDDCAIIQTKNRICISSDLFLEDIHFRRSYFSPQEIGAKALTINVSDLAGCGARPVGFTLNLGLPSDIDFAWLDEFFTGLASVANRYRMTLVGGDLSRCQQLSISITVWGETWSADTEYGFLTRGGVVAGDTIFVIGQPGLARVGLAVLEEFGRDALETWPAACAAHLHPEAQVDAGLMLARAGENSRPPALMDLSDGLVRDLPRLLGLTGELATANNKLGADLVLPRGLLHPEVIKYAELKGLEPVKEALLGGEEYGLLGACAPDMMPALHAAIHGFFSLGTVTNGPIVCNNQSIKDLHGFDHFENF